MVRANARRGGAAGGSGPSVRSVQPSLRVLGAAALVVAGACSSSKLNSSPQPIPPTVVVTTAITSPPSKSTTTSSAPPVPARARLRLTELVHGLDNPVAMAIRSGDPALYVAEQYRARVLAIIGGAVRSRPVVDMHANVSKGPEQGLLDMVFSPDGTKLYLDYTDPNGDSHVDEYTMRSDGTADPASRRSVLFQHQPYPNHNGGQLAFGPDGYLYIGLGDGGFSGDPEGNAQNRDTLLGKILRIDPHPSGTQPYAVPSDNPFVGTANTRPEIWMWGLRNPWRFSFDRRTDAMWIGDVGQDRYEEVDVAPSGSEGLNFEWPLREGLNGYRFHNRPEGGVQPVYDYPHEGGACSITGGYVYRGTAIAHLAGAYVFADFCAGNLTALTPHGTGRAAATDLHAHVDQPTSFGQDAAGELYVLALGGTVFKLTPA